MNFKIHHKNIKGGKEKKKKNGALDSARKKKDGSEHSTKNEWKIEFSLE